MIGLIMIIFLLIAIFLIVGCWDHQSQMSIVLADAMNFLDKLKKLSNEEVGSILESTYLVKDTIHKDGGVDLMYPASAISMYPDMHKKMLIITKNFMGNRFLTTQGFLVWALTIRLCYFNQLISVARSIWLELFRGINFSDYALKHGFIYPAGLGLEQEFISKEDFEDEEEDEDEDENDELTINNKSKHTPRFNGKDLAMTRKFIQIQMMMAISFLCYQENIECDVDKVVNKIFSDIYQRRLFTDFLPAYYWGVIDASLKLKNIEPGGFWLAQITIGMMQLYGFEPECGSKESANIFHIHNNPCHPLFSSITGLRVSGSIEYEKFISLLFKKEMPMEQTFGKYLCQNHDKYLLEIIRLFLKKDSEEGTEG